MPELLSAPNRDGVAHSSRCAELAQAKSAVLNTLSSVDSQRTYGQAMDQFIRWYCSEPRLAFSRIIVLRYRIHLERSHYVPATINLHLAAVRRLAYEATDAGLLSAELAAGIHRGRVFRPVNKGGRMCGRGITPKVIWHVVRTAAKRAGIQEVAPHDLRRTCARLCHRSGGELEQIQFLLGHVSIQTTERYLGCQQKLQHAVNDHLGIAAW